MLTAPFGSEFDPSEEAEGSIDPLGLQPTYERLADRLLPAVTVRMGRPRFVTAMALGAIVCSDWDDDAVAADDVTPPWLVYEWFVVEAFVRAKASLKGDPGIPGIQKVGNAVRNKRPIDATSYLKTPSVFGFSGVFRRLGKGIGILTEDGRLDDGGYELLAAWGKDKGLEGIIDAKSGEGHRFREKLRRAVAQGMEKGHTTGQPSDFWRELVEQLDPATPGRTEKRVLLERILSRAGEPAMIAVVKDALIAQGGISNREEEAAFLRRLSKRGPIELRQLLTAIDAYEGFARLITTTFDELRYLASQNDREAIDGTALTTSNIAKKALRTLAPTLEAVRAHPTLLEWEGDPNGLVLALERFAGIKNVTDLFEAVLGHHEYIQSHKPPSGKRAWIERAPRGRVVVRSGYLLQEQPGSLDGYVHEYRMPTFSGFLSDLGAFR